METILVNKDYNNMRIDRFLLKHFSGWSAIWIFKLIRLKKILLNNQKCSPSMRIFNGDVIQIRCCVDFLEAKNSKYTIYDESIFNKISVALDVLYEDENIVVIKKSPNIESQSSNRSGLNTIQNCFLKFLWLRKKFTINDSFVPSICNRLDRNTSGLILAAKNLPAQQVLQNIIRNREISKFYWCLVCEKPNVRHAVLTDFLFNDQRQSTVVVSHSKTNAKFKKIITEYKILRSYNNSVTLLQVNLITGRTHQIRAHCAFYGFPIVGDRKYGNGRFKNIFPYQALHNYQIRFNLRKTDHLLSYLDKKIFTWSDAWFLKKSLLKNL